MTAGGDGPPSRDEALERAIADACLGDEATADAMARDLRGFLEARGVHPDDVDAFVASNARAPARLGVYRALVRNGLSGVVLRMLPRTRARMNAACDGRFDRDLARFVADHGPRTHHLRDVPAELFAWAETRWRSDPSIPAYLPDLASYELTTVAVNAAEDGAAHGTGEIGEIALDRPVVFTRAMRLVAYAFAVHELDDDGAAPERRDARLLAYRDPASKQARWLELTPLAASLVDRLVAGEALGAAIEGACAEHAVAPAQVLTKVTQLLAELAGRGVILGAPAQSP